MNKLLMIDTGRIGIDMKSQATQFQISRPTPGMPAGGLPGADAAGLDRGRAFTLTEVMISVALLLVIMIGVTQVFRTTANVMGTSAALADSIRGFRTVASAMRNDFEGPSDAIGQGVVKTSEMPFLVIRNQEVNSYLSATDQIEGEAALAGGVADTKTLRRVDTLAIFARGSFRRATGQPAGQGDAPMELQVNQTSTDAWIWYGHLALPADANATTNGDTWHAPGQGDKSSNPFNYFAKDWVLGRQAILLKPISSSPTSSELNEFRTSSGKYYQYVGYPKDGDPENNTFDSPYQLVPLQYNTTLKFESDYKVIDSICDLAAVPNYPAINQLIAGFSARVLDYSKVDSNWWQRISTNDGADPDAAGDNSYRFRCNPFPSRPLEDTPGAAIKLSQTSPQMLRGVTQFIVEYAGDFDTHAGVDIEDSVSGESASPARIRWYGLERDSNGDGVADVRPVSALAGSLGPKGSTFERKYHFDTSSDNNFLNCVWDPADPKNATRTQGIPTMIRITIEYASPTGRLAQPVRQEFIYALPY